MVMVPLWYTGTMTETEEQTCILKQILAVLESRLTKPRKSRAEKDFSENEWAESISKYINGKASVSLREVLSAIQIPYTQLAASRVARCLRSLDWKRRNLRRPDAARQWRYFNPTER